MSRHKLYFKTGGLAWGIIAAVILVLVGGSLGFIEIQAHWEVARYFVFPVLSVMIIYITGYVVHNTA